MGARDVVRADQARGEALLRVEQGGAGERQVPGRGLGDLLAGQGLQERVGGQRVGQVVLPLADDEHAAAGQPAQPRLAYDPPCALG